jgi:hypothetical protein
MEYEINLLSEDELHAVMGGRVNIRQQDQPQNGGHVGNSDSWTIVGIVAGVIGGGALVGTIIGALL